MAVLMPMRRPADIHERPARVAGVNWGVGLDKALIILDAHAAPVSRADNPVRNGLAHAEGIADRQHQIAHLHVAAFRQRHRGQVVGINLDHCDITLGIKSDHLGVEFAPVLQSHFDVRWSVYQVAVGQDVAVLSHNDPGPKAALERDGENLLATLGRKSNARGGPLPWLPSRRGCRVSGP